MTAPYQLLPALTADELHDLRGSIETHGVMVPVLIDADGDVIDGHHRQQIADDLGIDYPVAQRSDLTETEKRTLALDLNLHRRHLTREQKRDVIARSLAADPHLSNRQHAERVGADHKTVGTVRGEMESTGEIPQSDERVSADGRTRPSTQPVRPPAGVDPDTGEIAADAPGCEPVEHSADAPEPDHTTGPEATAPGPAPAPKTRRTPYPEAVSKAAWDFRKSVERLERLTDDNRFPEHRERVATALRGHLDYATEALTDLLVALDTDPQEDR